MLPLQQMEKKYLYGITAFLLLIFFVVIMGLNSYQRSYDVCQSKLTESSTTSLTVTKHLEDSKAIYSKQVDQALKDQENFKNRLEHTELEKNQYFQNMSLLDGDKRELNVKFMICSDQLVKCAQKTDELEAKLSDAAKEKDESVHHLKNKEIQHVKCSEQLTMCSRLLDECKLSKQHEAGGFMFIIVVVGCVAVLCTCLCTNK